MTRVLIVTNGNAYAQAILRPVFEHASLCVVGVVVVSGDYSGRSGVRAFWGVARRTAVPYLLAKVSDRLVGGGSGRWVKRLHGLGIPVTVTPSIRADGPRQMLADLAPDILASVSCPQRIPASLVSMCSRGGVNIHSSLLPSFAGLAPYYWVLANGETRTGVTVHWLTERFDDGDILSQAELDVHPGDSAFGLFERLCIAGGDVLVEGLGRAVCGGPSWPQDRSRRSYYSHPTLASYRRLRHNSHRVLTFADLRRKALARMFAETALARREGS